LKDFKLIEFRVRILLSLICGGVVTLLQHVDP